MPVTFLQSAFCSTRLAEAPGPYASHAVPAPRAVCFRRRLAFLVDSHAPSSRISKFGGVARKELGSGKVSALAPLLRRALHFGFLSDSRTVRCATRRVDGARLSRGKDHSQPGRR